MHYELFSVRIGMDKTAGAEIFFHFIINSRKVKGKGKVVTSLN
jgi:hypothetical protein